MILTSAELLEKYDTKTINRAQSELFEWANRADDNQKSDAFVLLSNAAHEVWWHCHNIYGWYVQSKLMTLDLFRYDKVMATRDVIRSMYFIWYNEMPESIPHIKYHECTHIFENAGRCTPDIYHRQSRIPSYVSQYVKLPLLEYVNLSDDEFNDVLNLASIIHKVYVGMYLKAEPKSLIQRACLPPKQDTYIAKRFKDELLEVVDEQDIARIINAMSYDYSTQQWSFSQKVNL